MRHAAKTVCRDDGVVGKCCGAAKASPKPVSRERRTSVAVEVVGVMGGYWEGGGRGGESGRSTVMLEDKIIVVLLLDAAPLVVHGEDPFEHLVSSIPFISIACI